MSRVYLLTGATGFLGGQLLRALSSNPDDEIHCLIRGRAAESPSARLEKVLKRLGVMRRAGIHAVNGDITLPKLGLSEGDYAALSRTCTHIIHSAAEVRFNRPLEEIRKLNVHGTERVLELTTATAKANPRFSHLDYISTAYVAGRQRGMSREDELPRGSDFKNTYERSKHEAEALVRAASAELPIIIHRPAIIVGSSVDGAASDVLYPVLEVVARWPLLGVPGLSRTTLDFVPVDFVVRALLHISGQGRRYAGRCFHLAAGPKHSVTLTDFLKTANEVLGARLVPVPPRLWNATVGPAVRALLARFVGRRARQAYDLYLPYFAEENPRFSVRNTEEALAGTDIVMPDAQELLFKCLSSAKASRLGGILDAPQARPESTRIVHPLGGSTLENWARLLVEHRGVDWRYVPRAVSLSMVSGVSAPARRVAAIRYDRSVRATRVTEPPVFVLGHWRSGTTLLHNLLSQSGDLGYVSTFQAMVPSGFLLQGGIQKTLAERYVPSRRPMDNMAMSLTLPNEEEFALGNTSPHSFYHGFYFPRAMRSYFDKYVMFEGLSPDAYDAWSRAYLDIVKKATLQHGGRRLVMKNPANTSRIPQLLAMFPDAKFVHIHRDPHRVFYSTRNLYAKMLGLFALQDYSMTEMQEHILDFYERMMRKLMTDRALVPAGNYAELRYETFEKNPLGELERVYGELGLPGFATAQPRFDAFMDTQARYEKNTFVTDPAIDALIDERWGFALDAFHYREPKKTRASARSAQQAPNSLADAPP